MSDWRAVARAADAGAPVALVTVLATEGSAPRGAGTRMAVTAAGSAGTIGGGALEWRASEQARALLAEPPGSWRVQDYPLGPLLGQCCGGRVRLLIERVEPGAAWLACDAPFGAELAAGRVERRPLADPAGWPVASARGERPAIGARFVERGDEARRRLLLFGAGHVGRAVARLAADLPIDLGWFDSRDEAAASPGVVQADPDRLVACAGAAAPDDAILILTHDHALDYRLAAAALASPARFVGLIGSATKRARFVARLERDGLAEAARARLTCPLGLAGIDGKQPAVIAFAAVAQLLAL